MYHFKATIQRVRENHAAEVYRVTQVNDPAGAPCHGMVDLNTRYHGLAVLTEHLAQQLGVRRENLQLLVEEQ